MGKTAASALLLLLVFFTKSALADDLRTTRGQKVRETAHRVAVSLDEGVATYRVQRSFHNQGKEAEEAHLIIDLPHGAVATGLRIYAAGKWHDGDLMHADKAEALYRELTGLGPSQPKDPTLLYWRWTSELGLRIFPILPGKANLVEYTLTIPAHYEDGKYFVSYPRKQEGSELAAPIVTLKTGQLDSVDGQAHPSRTVRLSPLPVDPVLKKLGRDDARTLVRSLRYPHASSEQSLAVDLNIEHTWSGDLQIELLDPEGKVHSIIRQDLSESENDLKKRIVIDYDGKTAGLWHLLISDHHPLDGGRLLSWSLTPVSESNSDSDASGSASGRTAASGTPSHRTAADRRVAAIPQPNPSQGNVATLGVALAGQQDTLFRLGTIRFPQVPNFARIEIDLAKKLSKLPTNHHVTFVLDTSHTMDEAGIEAQLRLARAYLSHVPTAKFALIGTARRAQLLSDFRPASRWQSVVAALKKDKKLSPQNGSFLDRGAAAAAKLVASSQAKNGRATSAVVLFTDDRLRSHWDNDLALPALRGLPPATTVHLVDLTVSGAPVLRRDDEHHLFPLAKERGGVAVYSEGAGHGKWSTLTQEALYLVRPDRLDHVRFSDTQWEMGDIEDTWREGQGFRWMDEVEQLASPTLHGQLWSKDVTFSPSRKEEFNRATAGFVFSLDHYQGLSKLQQYVVATYARAVSPVTSYLAVEPGVRPSTIGLERGIGGVGGMGQSFGLGGMGMHQRGILWNPHVQKVLAACNPQRVDSEKVTVTLETNGHEIGDVRTKSPPPPSAPASSKSSGSSNSPGRPAAITPPP